MEREPRVTRRTFLKALIVGTVAGVTGGGAYLCGRISRLYDTDQKRKWELETPGYVIEDLGGGMKSIELLEAGKRTAPQVWEHQKDIRQETLAQALKELGQTCQIDSITPITEKEGALGIPGTSGLIVRVSSCK